MKLILMLGLLGAGFLGCEYHKGFLKLTFLPESWVIRQISTFGIMLAGAFLAGNYIIQTEFRRLNISRKIGDNIIIFGVIGGIIGSKIFFMFEAWNDWNTLEQFLDRALKGGGLVWYGGLIVAGGIITWYIKKKGYSFFYMGDVLTPAIALGHSIGRLGCLFSGDGCYGTICPYNWPAPFAMNFQYGQAPWNRIISDLGHDPNTAIVYNTPLFETIYGLALFLFFWFMRKKPWPVGFKFVTFLMVHVSLRFSIEFLRLNEFNIFGLTQAQFIGVIVVTIGAGFFVYRREDLITFVKGGFKWQQSTQ